MSIHTKIIKKFQNRIEELWLNRIYEACANSMEGADYGDFIIAQTGDAIFREMIKTKGYKIISFNKWDEAYKSLEQDIVKELDKERAKEKK